MTYNSSGDYPSGHCEVTFKKGPVLTYNNESYPLHTPIGSSSSAVKQLSPYEQALLEGIRTEMYPKYLRDHNKHYKQQLKWYKKIATASILSTITLTCTTLYFKFFGK